MDSHRRQSSKVVRVVPGVLRWPHIALGLTTVGVVSGAGGVGYALPTQTSAIPAAAPAAPAPTTTTTALAAAAPASAARLAATGPVLVDQDGHTLDPALAARISTVYAALASGDLQTIRQAYAHTGSDDWSTSSPHLASATVRNKLLAALRRAPAHTASDSYRFSAAGYRLSFGATDAGAVPGLVSISGPRTTSTNSATAWKTTSARPRASSTSSSAICDLSGPPVFGDPEHPNVITNRDCGYTDPQGRARSHDPWIDDQLTAAGQ